MSRARLLLLIGGAAVVVAGGIVAAIVLTRDSKTVAPAPGAGRVTAMLRGIPQQGTALGSPDAPVTLVEFADLQCPYCRDWAVAALPTLIREYVVPGKVRIVFNGMHFVGPDSETALRTALAAAAQQRFWHVLELLYANQGTENTGWVTDSLLRSIGKAVPGLDGQKMLDSRNSAAVDRLLAQADAVAKQAGVQSTPTFAVGKTGAASLELVQVTSLDAAGLEPALNSALAG